MQNPEIARVKKGFDYPRNGYIIKGRPTIYATSDEAYAAAEALPEPKRPAAPQATAPAKNPQRDRQATRVANLLGLPAPKVTGNCHYCGLPLTNGNCEGCV